MPYLTPRIWNYRDEESSEDYGAISRQTAMITAGVVIGVVILGLVACGCYRRRRNRRRMMKQVGSLPTHTSQLPPPPPAYIRPTTSADLSTYRPPQNRSGASGSHAAWALPAPPYQSPKPEPPTTKSENTPPVAPSRPTRHSIFRRPVPPLLEDDPAISSSRHTEEDAIPQVTRYETRRGENPFGSRGIDGRHPGVAASEAGDVAGEQIPEEKGDAPPGYGEVIGRAQK